MLQLHESGADPTRPDRLTPAQQLVEIADKTQRMVAEQYRCWNESLLPALADEGIRFWEARHLQGEHLDFVWRYWREELEPILTPIVVDPAHPFPSVINKALSIGSLLQVGGRTLMGVVTVPRVLPRLLRLPDRDGRQHFVTLAGVMDLQISELFRGCEVIASSPFRVTRNSELYLNEEEADNLMEEIAEQVKNQRQADAVRLEISTMASADLVHRLQEQFEIDDSLTYRTNGPVNLHRLFSLYDLVQRYDLKYRSFTPSYTRRPKSPNPSLKPSAKGTFSCTTPTSRSRPSSILFAWPRTIRRS